MNPNYGDPSALNLTESQSHRYSLVATDEGEYKGKIVNGKRQGLGTCTWLDNSIYEGEWFNGLRQGNGKFTRPGDGTYKG